MGGDHDRPLATQLLDFGSEQMHTVNVEARLRLVEDEVASVAVEGPGDRKAFPLPARQLDIASEADAELRFQLVGQAFDDVSQANPGQRAPGPFDVDQTGIGLLCDELEHGERQVCWVLKERRDRARPTYDFTGRRREQSGHDLQQGRFTRAVGAHHHVEARGDVKRYVAQAGDA